MRSITLIIIHCSAVLPWQRSSAKDINIWHKRKGWKCIGYHYVVRRDGSIELGRPLEQVGSHCVKHNRYSIGICYEGGLNAAGEEVDTRTPEQRVTLRKLVEELHQRFPRALILGHHDLNPGKKCPCYNAAEEYRDLQPP